MIIFHHTIIFLLTVLAASFSASSQPMPPDRTDLPSDTVLNYCFVNDYCLSSEGWDTLSHPKFWRQVMNLDADSGIINISTTRQIVGKMASAEWNSMDEAKKAAFRDSIRNEYCLTDRDRIFFTTGKKYFYKIEEAIPGIEKAVKIFEREKTDPWYAQVILMIESPGKLQKSSVGAYGSFQLMPGVARQMGLKVTKYVDERRDFDRSAYAAAKLIRTICIPYTNAMLDKRGIAYNDKDLWYRLLVLHVYHAGAYNVAGALDAVNPTAGDISLITTLWQTETGRFKNASQNYSQIALASLMELQEIMANKQLATK